MAKRAGKRVRWTLYILKSKAQRVGSFEGPEDPQEALKLGLDEHDIPEAERWRYSVQRES